MKLRLPALLLACLGTSAYAEVLVEDAHVRALPPGATTTAAYMRLRNTGADDVQLVGAESPVASSVTMHSSMNHDGMIHMMPAGPLVIPARDELVLQSGGTHLMFEGLSETLVPGTMIGLTLRFDDGSSTVVDVPVRSVFDE